MNRLIRSSSHDPFHNVAVEQALFHQPQEGITLFLWQNAPTVFIGRNQNVYKETAVDYLAENDIRLVRRLTGGGAVYQDMGNLNYTFLTKERAENDALFQAILLDAFQSVGITATFSGRNDITTEGKKFSGQAYLMEDGKYMYHGTILCHVDMEKLVRAITPSPLKIQTKAIASVRQRVVNLCEINPSLTIEGMERALHQAFSHHCGQVQTSLPPAPDENTLKLLRSKEWQFNQSPNFQTQWEGKVKNQLLQLEIHNVEGIMQDVVVYSDSLAVDVCETIKKRLIGQPFEHFEQCINEEK